ncbi:class D sortase [Planococcus sp. S3-L1]|uniref:class D sortase n=1 Tax=Planococcus sp. S3-L1 TaxID=3046200 RepID=UPI0024BA7DDD|nr:class D sortase [Planococcus sp. S3-L1]MDJ0332584.1 class D sortase [Planococcus sp. S3-L1]
MRRRIGVILIVMGLLFAVWNGYKWLFDTSSGQRVIGDNDIAQADKFDSVDVPAKVLVEKEASEQLKKSVEPKQRTYEEYDRGDDIGWLLIPSLGKKYPVYWGTDDDTLTQGVGYHVGNFTVPPDGQRHTVLSGHRDTVFRELGDLKEGDSLFVQFEGMQYEYKITQSWITAAEDRTVIVTKDEPVLTLTTCYPFNFLGAAPDRYIIEAPLVNITEMD